MSSELKSNVSHFACAVPSSECLRIVNAGWFIPFVDKRADGR